MKQMNQRDAIHYIATQQEFRASALEGRVYGVGNGRLDEQETAYYNIAWYTEGNGWYVVEQKFSSTTSKHQNYVRQAIAEANELVGA